MREETTTALLDPNGFSADPLTDLIRSGARRLIEQALEAELSALLAQFADETTPEGRTRIVRHGHLPEREVMTGAGPVAAKVPGVRASLARLARHGGDQQTVLSRHEGTLWRRLWMLSGEIENALRIEPVPQREGFGL